MNERRSASGPAPAGAAARGRRRLRRIAAAAGIGLLALVLLLAAAVTWLAGTSSGLRFAVAHLRPHLPQGIAFAAADGRLVGPLTVRGLRVRSGGTTVRVERIALDWDPAALLRETLHIDHIEAAGVDIELAAGDSAGARAGPPRVPLPPEAFTLPLAVELERLAVDRVRVRAPSGAPRSIEHVRLRARADAQRIALEAIAIEAPQWRVSGRLSVGVSAPHRTAGALAWRLAGAGARPPLAGRLAIDGRLADLRLEQALSAPTAARIRARLRAFGDAPSWSATVELAETRPSAWLPAAPRGTVRADLTLEGTFRRVRIGGGFTLGELPGGPYRGELDLSADAGALQVHRLALRQAGGDAKAALTGTLGYGDTQQPLRFDGVLDWQRLQWPLTGAPRVASPQGRLGIEGRPARYDLDLDMRVRRPDGDLPPASVALRGRGSMQALEQVLGHIEWAGGRVDVDGRVGWAESPGARLALGIERLALARLTGGRVDGRLDARAELEAAWGDGLAAGLRVARLGGTLNGQSIGGGARLRYTDGTIELPQLRLTAGDARLSVSGRLDRRVALDWSLRIPQLRALYRPAAGRLEGRGEVRGPRASPTLAGELRGSGLRWQDLRIGGLELRARAATPPSAAATIDLALTDLRVAGYAFDRLTGRLEGTPDDHRLRLDLAAPGATAGLAVAGGLDGGDWRGRVAALTLRRSGEPAWRLASPAGLRRVDGRFALERACLVRAPARLCVAAEGTPADWRVRAEAEAVPYALAGSFGPRPLDYKGAFALEATLAGGERPVTGRGRLELGAGQVTQPGDEGPQRLAEWRAGQLEATLSPQRIDARLRLPLADGGRIAATVGIGRRAPHPLSGKLAARVTDPSIVAALVSQIGSIGGRFEADMTLGGTLEAPRATGSAALVDGRVGVVPLGIELRELQLSVETRQRGLRLRAAAESGGGRLQASLGLQHEQPGGWSGEGRIRGEAFVAARLPELELTVSPDLRWRVADRLVHLEGSLDIPRARIEPRDLSGVVQPSPDAVIVDGAGRPAPDAQPAWRVDARVDVTLGEDVRIDAFGLDARLGGAITVRQRPGKLAAGTGELRVEQGEYTIYRQTLQIERGRMLFEGGPLIDPGLDVRAVRRPRDVLVGVNVRGTLREPRAELFSEPPMPESQQLSYLIAGVPLGRTTGEDRSAMAAVAGALATSEKGRALAQQLGIDEVSIDRSGQAGASLVLGRYLSPRLYVAYGIGLAEQANSVRMRYELTRRWTLEGQAGLATSADLLYTIETD